MYWMFSKFESFIQTSAEGGCDFKPLLLWLLRSRCCLTPLTLPNNTNRDANLMPQELHKALISMLLFEEGMLTEAS